MSEYMWWFEQAMRDLRKAVNALSTEDYDAVAFWCHQAVEKGLKALLLSRGYVARGHNLVDLGRRIKEELSLNIDEIMDDLMELNPHYTISRYPNAANAPPYQIYNRSKAEDLISRAKRVLNWIKQFLH